MTNKLRAELIDRFRSGMMSQAEQAQFRQQIASDPQLRRMLDAEDAINGAMRSELAGIATDHAVTRARVMESLAAVSGSTGHPGFPRQYPQGGASTPGGGISGLVKAIAATLVVGGVAAGVYGVWPHGDVPPTPPPAGMVQPMKPQPQEVAPSAPAAESVTGTTPPASEEPAIRSAAPAERTMPHAQPRTNVPAMSHTPAATAPTLQPQPDVVVPPETKLQQKEIQIRRSDSVKLQIKVKK